MNSNTLQRIKNWKGLASNTKLVLASSLFISILIPRVLPVDSSANTSTGLLKKDNAQLLDDSSSLPTASERLYKLLFCVVVVFSIVKKKGVKLNRKHIKRSLEFCGEWLSDAARGQDLYCSYSLSST